MTRYVLDVTGDFTPSDAEAVGAICLEYIPQFEMARVETDVSDFVNLVRDGQANPNIIRAVTSTPMSQRQLAPAGVG